MYTAVPHNATVAPSSHMIRDNPTLPDERRMTLGVAKILSRIDEYYTRDEKWRIYTVPMTLLNIKDVALVGPTPVATR